jgi:hypothetical protein
MLSRIYSLTDRNRMLLITAHGIENRPHGAKTLRITARACNHRADKSVRPYRHPCDACGVA